MEVAGDAMKTVMIVAAEMPTELVEMVVMALGSGWAPVSSVVNRDISPGIAR